MRTYLRFFFKKTKTGKLEVVSGLETLETLEADKSVVHSKLIWAFER